MAPDPATTAARAVAGKPPCVRSTFCVGNIHYPVGHTVHPAGALGRLVVIKSGVPTDAPAGVADFHLRNPRFPCDPTLDQLYSADRFDAYKSLGNFAATQALSYVSEDFEAFRQHRRVGAWRGGRGRVGPPI
jgi:hypothetical protein